MPVRPERRRCWLVAGALTVLVATGCSQPGEEAALPAPKTVHVGGTTGQELAVVQVLHAANGAEPETLDPHRATGVTAANVQREIGRAHV